MSQRPRNTRKGSRSNEKTSAPNFRRHESTGIGGDVVIGRNSVRELVAGKRLVKEVLIGESVENAAVLDEIRELAFARRILVRDVSREELLKVGSEDGTQSVVAFTDPIRTFEVEELVASSALPFLLLVDGVTDPRNLGALLRTAEVAGVTGVVLGRNRSARLSPAATKAAAGAIEHLKFAYVANIAATVADLKKKGVWVAGLESEANTSLFDFNLADQPVAFVMGAEGKGVSQLVRDRCDLLVSIPQFGQTESLNVSVAGALAMYEVARRRTHPRK